MRRIKATFILVGTVATLLTAQAQRTLVDVDIEPASIWIGEQTTLHVTVTTDRNHPVQLLLPTDTLMHGVEVLDLLPPDSTLIENNRLVVRQDVLLTSFDSSLYLLPPVRVVDGADTVYSQQVALKVSTVPLDEENPDQFFDIKAIWKPSFMLSDYYPYILGVLIAALLAYITYYIVRCLRRKSTQPVQAKPKLPPHIQATRELDALKQQKLWQQDLYKEYHTLLTDILRRYITDRFDVNAMEMTSDEILTYIRQTHGADSIPRNTDSVYRNLEQILRLSDFVKFAKLHPLPDENALSLMNAYLFVSQTQPEDTPTTPTTDHEEENEGETKTVS